MIKYKKGFTLIELLVYLAIFAVAAGMLTGILATFVRIQSREAASASVSQELSFVQTTLQRLVRESVNIENPAGTASSTLILRMASSTLDPTIISRDANAIYLKQGNNATSTLTSARVRVSEFQAVKYENPGGHAIAQIDLSLTYNSPRIYQQITQNLKTSIGRVTAATFDDNLIPNQDNQFSIGLTGNRWQSLTLSNVLNLGTLATDPATCSNGSLFYNSTANVFKGCQNSAWSVLTGYWAASSTNIYNTNSGNVGVNTTNPLQKFQVNDTATAAFVVTSAGQVGIGTGSPTQKLDVADQIHATGDICTDAGGGKCLSSVGSVAGSTYFGGMYMQDWSSATCYTVNPITGSCSCPAGFSSQIFKMIAMPAAAFIPVRMAFCYKN
jgi:prepilin-type N-terminal cleavage/methylation domain-containing protein